ncbi:MAG: hypothetical protein ACUVRH_05380 [Candidatus Bipolaricaulia bacterium]
MARPEPEPFDSAARAVREVALALTGRGRGLLEPYPRGAGLALFFLRLLPGALRLRAIEWGISRILSSRAEPERTKGLNLEALPKWCVTQYPSGKYPAIIVGAPSGGIAHLGGLLGAPFLTASFLLSFRHKIEPDDLQSYCRFGAGLAERLLQDDAGDFEAVNHYDPLHDRPLVKQADLLRFRLIRLPRAYREFIEASLAPEGYLVLSNCTYPWPQYRLNERSFLQVGGLGGVSPAGFLERWSLPLPLEERPESEWGCPPGLAEDLRRFAREHDFRLIELRFDHPWGSSLLAYRAYLAAGGREDELMLDCFTYISPLTNSLTGIPALWLPYIDRGSFAFAKNFLEGKSFTKIYLALAPSFARAPDSVHLDEWISFLSQRARVVILGLNRRRYPADPWAPFAYNLSLMRRLRKGPSQRLHLTPRALEGLTGARTAW